jgi:hypothetical protein
LDTLFTHKSTPAHGIDTPCKDLEAWKLTPAELQAANARSNHLGGEHDWLPTQVNLITKTFRLKGVDFVRMSRGAMSYVFAGLYQKPGQENIKQAFDSFNETLRLNLTTHYNADGAPVTDELRLKAAKVMEQANETLSLLEMCSPFILFSRILHFLKHIAMAGLKWNACRVYWTFGSERYTYSTLFITTNAIPIL